MKNRQIDSLKGILMLMIVFYHYTYRFQELYQIQTINFFTLEFWGIIGVAGFFIISGYFIFPKDTDNYNVKQHLVKRIARLYPAYLLCLTVIFISVKVFRITKKRSKFFGLLVKYNHAKWIYRRGIY